MLTESSGRCFNGGSDGLASPTTDVPDGPGASHQSDAIMLRTTTSNDIAKATSCMTAPTISARVSIFGQGGAEVRDPLPQSGEMELRGSASHDSAAPKTSTMMTPASSDTGSPSAFAQGWRKLPDELKMEILAYNLTSREVITAISSRTCCFPGPYQCIEKEVGAVLIDHMLMGPEIAPLARQVFCEANDFTIRLFTNHVRGRGLLTQRMQRARFSILLPPLLQRPLIRRLCVIAGIGKKDWLFLTGLKTSFTSLKNLVIVFSILGSGAKDMEEFLDSDIEPLVFDCKGYARYEIEDYGEPKIMAVVKGAIQFTS